MTNQFDNFFQRNSHLPCLGSQSVDPLRDNSHAITPAQAHCGIRHIGASGSSLNHNSRLLQLTIGTGHRVGINQQLFSQNPNGRKFLVRCQTAGRNEVFNLIDDLQINWNAVSRRNVQLHAAPLLY